MKSYKLRTWTMDRVREIDRSNLRSRSRSVDVTSLPILELDATVDPTSRERQSNRDRDRERNREGETQIEEVDEIEGDIGIREDGDDEDPLGQRAKENISDIVDSGLVGQNEIKNELSEEKEQTTIAQLVANWFQLLVQLENTGSVARDHVCIRAKLS